jgi:hypothetical protein
VLSTTAASSTSCTTQNTQHEGAWNTKLSATVIAQQALYG